MMWQLVERFARAGARRVLVRTLNLFGGLCGLSSFERAETRSRFVRLDKSQRLVARKTGQIAKFFAT